MAGPLLDIAKGPLGTRRT